MTASGAALLAGDPSGAAVGDVACGVERAEVAADGHVVGPELEADAGGLQRPAADQVLHRIVAEQAQVSRSAAGGDAGGDRDHAAQDAAAGQGVEVRRLGGFQLGLAARLDRQAAQAVGHQHDDFRVVLDHQSAPNS